jgi:cobalt-zinc-cadmium efflux system protein
MSCSGHHHHSHSDSAFAWGSVWNGLLVAGEFAVGAWTGSAALLADATHNLSDTLSLLLAWGARVAARRPATAERTYGHRRLTAICAFVNTVVLLGTLGFIAWEAVTHWNDQSPMRYGVVMVTAAIALLVNGWTAWGLHKGSEHDLNTRAAYLHMATDAGVSLAVLAGAGISAVTGWRWIDGALALTIVGLTLRSSWPVCLESWRMVADGVPANIDLPEVRAALMAMPGVTGTHDLHVWSLSTTESALTAHLVVNHERLDNGFLGSVHECLRNRFGIAHTTLQVEAAGPPLCHGCPLA